MRLVLLFIFIIAAFAQPNITSLTTPDTTADITHSGVRLHIGADANVTSGTYYVRADYSPSTDANCLTSGKFQIGYTKLTNGNSDLTKIWYTITGLDPGDYKVCVRVSANTTGPWSATYQELAVTIPALPSVHPVLPTAPTEFDVDEPAVTGTTFVVTNAGNTCTTSEGNNWSPCTQVASSNFATCLKAGTCGVPGDQIVIDSAATLTGNFCLPAATSTHGVKTTNGAGWNTTTDVITINGHGWSDGQKLRFGGSDGTNCDVTSITSGLIPGYDYYVVNSTANTFQLAATLGGTPLDLTGLTVTTVGFMPWPIATNTDKYLTIRASLTDAQLPPAGSRMIGAEWSGRLPKLVGTVALRPILSTSRLSTHIYLKGIEIVPQAYYPGGWASITSTDASYLNSKLFQLSPDSSYIVYDRMYIHGLPIPESIAFVSGEFNGSYNILKNSELSNLHIWRPWWYATFIPARTSGTVVTVPAGTMYGVGNQNCTFDSSQTVTISGSATGTAYWQIGMDCRLKITLPTGISAVCSGTCDLFEGTNYQLDAESHPMGSKWGTWTISSGSWNTTICPNNSTPWCNVSLTARRANATEGPQFLSGYGPGPLLETNNTYDGAGIIHHYSADNTLTGSLPKHVRILKNYWTTGGWRIEKADTSVVSHVYNHRHLLEHKSVEIEEVSGNFFVWGMALNNQGSPLSFFANSVNKNTRGPDSATNPFPESIRHVNINNNIIAHGPAGLVLNGGPPMSGWQLPRQGGYIRVKNNLIYDINASVYGNAETGVAAGTGLGFQLGYGMHDVILENNTLFGIRGGLAGASIYLLGKESEGLHVRNNIFDVNNPDTSHNYYGSHTEMGASNVSASGTSCASLDGQAAMDCAMKNTAFSGNVWLPRYTTALTDTGDLTSAAFSGAWTSALVADQVVSGATPAARTTALGFIANNESSGYVNADFRLMHSSAYVGKGVDFEALNSALGLTTNVGLTQITSNSAKLAYTAPTVDTVCTVEYSTSSVWGSGSRLTDTSSKQSYNPRRREVTIPSLSSGTLYYWRLFCGVPSIMPGLNVITTALPTHNSGAFTTR